MKTKLVFIALTLGVSVIGADAQGTAFTYQGRLNDGANPAAGIYDLRFTIYDSTNNPGVLIAGPLTNAATSVSNGLFTAALDFGSGVFDGTPRFLEIAVRTNGGVNFVVLNPRQPLTPTPYAIFANSASNLVGALSPSQLSGTYNGPVHFNNGADTFDGTFVGQFFGSTFTGGNFTGNFIGSGSGLYDVWHTGGNAGTTPANFLGTTDNQPLILKVYGQEVMRYEASPETPNVIGGWSGNYVQPDLTGVTIGGGGSPFPFGGNPQPNVVTNYGFYGVIAGGYNNMVTNYGGSILGGSVNLSGGNFATIGGGQSQTNLGHYSVIGGGFANTIQAGSGFTTIGGGYGNFVGSNSGYSFIGSGYQNTNDANGFASAVVSGVHNLIGQNNYQSVIGGGFGNSIDTTNYEAFIGGGYLNVISGNNSYPVIVGGSHNTISSNAASSTISGGTYNVIGTGAVLATISGGTENSNSASYGVIGGGLANINTGSSSFIGGGIANTTSGGLATSVGGQGNAALNNNTTIVGGLFNTNYGVLAFIGGGDNNFASGWAAVISGGESNRAWGQFSMASGYHAGALNDGTFVWSDFQPANFGSTSSNQFLIRAQNGVGINTNNPQAALHVNGNIIANNFLGSGSSLSGLSFSQLTGALLDSQLAGPYSGAVGFSNPGNSFTGNGSGLTSLNASSLSSGTVADARLSANIPNLNGTQTFTGANTFSGSTYLNGFVGFGTTSSIGAANFVMSQNTAGFGGMYINTTSATGKPFYGYAQNGLSFAYHYVDGSDAYKWKLILGSGTVVVTQAGFLGLGNSNPTNLLMVGTARCDGSTWINASDRNLKENFTAIDGAQILEKVAHLPITLWNYKTDGGTVHLGPVAQDFRAAFQLGADDRSIATVDESGVALAAIQGLNQKLEEKEARIRTLEKELAEIKNVVDKLAHQKE